MSRLSKMPLNIGTEILQFIENFHRILPSGANSIKIIRVLKDKICVKS